MTLARRILSTLLVVTGTAVVMLGLALSWASGHVFDTAAVTATTRTVLAEPGVQRLLEREITDRVMSYVVDERYRPTVAGIVKSAVESPESVELVAAGVGESHRSLVSGAQPVVELNLRALAADVRTRIIAVAPNLEAALPSPDGAFRFQIVRRSELPGTWRWVDGFEGSAAALVVLGAALAGLGFVLGPSRWALAILAGALVLAAGLFGLAVSHRALDEANARITDATAATAARAILGSVFRSFDGQARAVAVTGGFAVLIGVGVRLIRPEYMRAHETW